MTEPLVSICIPTFNGERYLEEALRSAFAQTYPRLEIVVSDDRSIDGTLSIIERLAPETSIPIRVHHHEPAGIGANWNHCVQKANGAYIKFLFQDDLLEPECVQRMMDMALQDERIGLVYCRRRIVHDTSNVQHRNWVAGYGTLHRSWRHVNILEGVMEGRDLLRDPALLEEPRNKIGEPTAVLLSRRSFDRAGWFDTRLKQILDYVHWYRIMRHYRIGFVDAELVTFRLHSEQMSQQNAGSRELRDSKVEGRLFLRQFWRWLHPAVRRKLLVQESVGRVVRVARREWKRVIKKLAP